MLTQPCVTALNSISFQCTKTFTRPCSFCASHTSELNPRQQWLSRAGSSAAFLSLVDKLFVTPAADGAHLMRVTMKEAQRDEKRDGGRALAQAPVAAGCSSGGLIISPGVPECSAEHHDSTRQPTHCASCSRAFREAMRCDTVMLSAVRLFSFREWKNEKTRKLLTERHLEHQRVGLMQGS